MSYKQNKISTFTAYSMMVASVIGIGVFVKNGSVFKATDNSPYSTLLAWIVTGVSCLFLVVAYCDISTTIQSRGGLTTWAKIVGGDTLANFIRTNYSFIYYGILLPVLGYFSAQIFLMNTPLLGTQTLKTSYIHNYFPILMTVGLGSLILLFFLFFNYLSLKYSGIFQNLSMGLIFIPLTLISVFGFLLLIYSPSDPNMFVKSSASTNGSSGKFSLLLTISALPPIMFAFDSFVNFGSLAPDIKNAQKKMPVIMIAGMSTVFILYLMITLASIFGGETVGWNIFKEDNLNKITNSPNNKTLALVFKHIIIFFVIFSILSTVNSFCASGVSLYMQQVENRFLVGSKLALKLANGDVRKGALYLLLIVCSIWSIPFISLSLIFNSDSFIDGISNFPVMFFFVIYGLIAILATVKKFKTKPSFNKKDWMYAFCATIGFIAAGTIMLYQMMYVYLYKQIIILGLKQSDIGWGGFIENDKSITISGYCVGFVFLGFCVLFMLTPTVNKKILTYFDNRQIMLNYLKPDDPFLLSVIKQSDEFVSKRKHYLSDRVNR